MAHSTRTRLVPAGALLATVLALAVAGANAATADDDPGRPRFQIVERASTAHDGDCPYDKTGQDTTAPVDSR